MARPKKMPEWRTCTMVLTLEQQRRLKVLATDTGIAQSEHVRRALDAYFKRAGSEIAKKAARYERGVPK